MHAGRVFYIILSIVFLSPVFAATEASAQEGAREFFKDGVSLFEHGNYKDAAEAFRKAYTLKASWKMFYNIGQSEAAAKRYGLALEAFEAYFAQGGDDVPSNRREEILKEIARLRVLVGVVKVKGEKGTELIIDDVSRGTTPFEGIKRVAVGRHKVVLKLGGEVIHNEMFTMAGGMTTVITPAPDKTNDNAKDDKVDNTREDASLVPVTLDSKKAQKLIIGGIIGGAVGLGLVGMGLGFTVKGGKDYNDRQDLYNLYEKTQSTSDFANYKDSDDVLKLDTAMMVIGYAAGGALVIAGTVMAIIGLKKKKSYADDKVTIIPTASGLAVAF